MIEIYKIKSDDHSTLDKYYVSLPCEEPDVLSLSEISLSGVSSDQVINFDKNSVELVSNPSPPWKAAFMVWKNSMIMKEINEEEDLKRIRVKDKFVELLAFKYGIEIETLKKIIKEIDEIEI